jgi:hypothetical protein
MIDEDNRWRWSYSKWVGVMYGPIPIGLIIGIPLLIAITR